MAGNSRLATAIHVAGMLSFAESIPLTSENIASSLNTNPVVVRRIIGALTKHGLVKVKMGTGGGSCLTRNPKDINLAEIYEAVDEGAIFEVPQFDEDFHCMIGKIVRPILAEVLGEVENDLKENLSKTTLADVLEKVKKAIAEKRNCQQRKDG